MRRLGIVISLLIVLLVCLLVRFHNFANAEVALAEAVTTAKKEVDRRGYSLREMTIEADELNIVWNDFISSAINYDPVPPDLKAKLQGHKFYAIHFSTPAFDPKTGTLHSGDGAVFVFVDKHDGKLLAVLAWGSPRQ